MSEYNWKQRRKEISNAFYEKFPLMQRFYDKILTQEQSMLSKAEEEKKELIEALNDYLEWGCKTSSDRDMFDNRFEKLVIKYSEAGE